MIGCLVVEMVIGYEWFISGLVKFVRGDFPAGLADELLKKSAGTAEWYGIFLESAVRRHRPRQRPAGNSGRDRDGQSHPLPEPPPGESRRRVVHPVTIRGSLIVMRLVRPAGRPAHRIRRGTNAMHVRHTSPRVIAAHRGGPERWMNITNTCPE